VSSIPKWNAFSVLLFHQKRVFITQVVKLLVADRLSKLDGTSILFRNGEGRKWSKTFRILFLYLLQDTKLFYEGKSTCIFYSGKNGKG